jgi:hypothetical protein
MSDLKVHHWTGAFGVAYVALMHLLEHIYSIKGLDKGLEKDYLP